MECPRMNNAVTVRRIIAEAGWSFFCRPCDAAAVLGFSDERTHDLMDQGRLEVYRVNGHDGVYVDSVKAFADAEQYKVDLARIRDLVDEDCIDTLEDGTD